MPLKTFGFFLGMLTVAVAGFQLFPLLWSLGSEDGAAGGLAAAAATATGAGAGLAWLCRSGRTEMLTAREGLAVVGLCWLAAVMVGALPYIFCELLSLPDAVFESASGFTTTGATVLKDIEAVPQGLLLWRSLTHWLGGMGIIVLSLAVLPMIGLGGMQLYKAEVPGPAPDKLTPRVRDTAKLLWKVYALLTLAEIVLLILAGMTVFDAINHTFATVATGGFSTKNASVGAYPSPVIQWIIIVFMFVAGINFALHFRMLRGEVRAYAKNTECRAYCGVILGVTGLMMANLALTHTMPVQSLAEFEALLRAAAFQTVSLMTTTGFVTENYALWPPLCLVAVLLISFMGGSAGSTGGGFKVMRVVVVFRFMYLEIFQILHPRSVRHLKIQGQALPPGVLTGVLGFLALYLVILILGTLVGAAWGLDLVTSFTASLTCLSNVGPGLGAVGPVDNFSALPTAIKGLLTLIMLLGRLELYALIVLFVPEFWRR